MVTANVAFSPRTSTQRAGIRGFWNFCQQQIRESADKLPLVGLMQVVWLAASPI